MKGNLYLSALASEQRQRSCESAAGTRPTDGDAGRIHIRLMGEPGQSVVAIMKWNWKVLFRREPVMMFGGGTQAFCGNDDCRLLTWDPTRSAASNLANASEVDWEPTDPDTGPA